VGWCSPGGGSVLVRISSVPCSVHDHFVLQAGVRANAHGVQVAAHYGAVPQRRTVVDGHIPNLPRPRLCRVRGARQEQTNGGAERGFRRILSDRSDRKHCPQSARPSPCGKTLAGLGVDRGAGTATGGRTAGCRIEIKAAARTTDALGARKESGDTSGTSGPSGICVRCRLYTSRSTGLVAKARTAGANVDTARPAPLCASMPIGSTHNEFGAGAHLLRRLLRCSPAPTRSHHAAHHAARCAEGGPLVVVRLGCPLFHRVASEGLVSLGTRTQRHLGGRVHACISPHAEPRFQRQPGAGSERQRALVVLARSPRQ
jgi:hypothetical protein